MKKMMILVLVVLLLSQVAYAIPYEAEIKEYNKDAHKDIHRKVDKLGFNTLVVVNTDDNKVYTIYLNQGKITKVTETLPNSNPDLIAYFSLKTTSKYVDLGDYSRVIREIKVVPFWAKIRIYKALWWG